MTSSINLEALAGRLLILETHKNESPDTLTPQEWKEYRHLKRQYNTLMDNRNRPKGERTRINYQQIRQYNDSQVWGER